MSVFVLNKRTGELVKERTRRALLFASAGVAEDWIKKNRITADLEIIPAVCGKTHAEKEKRCRRMKRCI